MPDSSALVLDRLKKVFPANPGPLALFENFNLEVKKGEFVTIFGPNGSGKTTLFEIIAGLEKPTAGSVNRRFLESGRTFPLTYVFQNYRETLFPWLNMAENITLRLGCAGASKLDREESFRRLYEKWGGIMNFSSKSYPYQLSGGEQQAGVFLRTVLEDAECALLDEPFFAIDYFSKKTIHQMIQHWWLESGNTIVCVSHDLDEAMLLGQRIVIFSCGKPTSVIASISNELPYPRNESATMSAKYLELKQEAIRVMKEDRNDE